MARVYMCDRCGQIFDPNKTEKISINNVSFAKIRPVVEVPKYQIPVQTILPEEDSNKEVVWDICSTCLRDFQRWWNVPKTEKRKGD